MSSIGFIGGGNMAEAIIKGLLLSKSIKKNEIIVSDINPERLRFITSRYGIKSAANNKDVVINSDLVILCVKPGVFATVLSDIKKLSISNKLFISIAAGINTSFIKKTVGKNIKIARVMPNTPSLVLEGASAVYFEEGFLENEKMSVLSMLKSVGNVYEIEKEDLMDAVTGLSGSGPAFVSIFIEALSDGGVKMGLTRDLSNKLAVQTVYGTSKMILETARHPSEIKDMVSSPGGTTINGVHKLEEKGFRDAVISAVEAAALRSKELSKEE
ncbi:MAG: pyrroline-5-carboxylate reductase [Thermodesulfobacteriota bacterium]